MYQNDFIACCITGSNDCRRSLYITWSEIINCWILRSLVICLPLPHLICRLSSKKRKAVLMFLQPTLCIVLYSFWCIWFWHLLFHKYKKPLGVYSVSTANIFPRRFFYFFSIVQLFLGYFFRNTRILSV